MRKALYYKRTNRSGWVPIPRMSEVSLRRFMLLGAWHQISYDDGTFVTK